MSQEKDDRKEDRLAASVKRSGETGEERRIPPSGSRATSKPSANGATAPVATKRRQQYLIGARRTSDVHFMGLQPQSMDVVADYLGRQDGVDILRRIKPSGPQPFSRDGGASEEVVVARIEEGRAENLKSAAQPQIIIERDTLLNCAHGGTTTLHSTASAAMLPLSGSATNLAIRVVGERDQPLAKVSVLIHGRGFPAQAVTDDTGTARLSWFGGQVESIEAIYVRPASNYWERLILAPELEDAGINTIKLRPLSETLPNFPNERLVGWGRRLMRLDQSGGTLTGAGVRIGIIDSGCDTTHPLLRHIVRGKDFTNNGSESSWTDDVFGHGTHCAGIIAGAATAAGIASFAPEAELHVFKVFPGGRLSDLLAALDECIARELDIVSIGVCSDEVSELVSQKLQEARHRGIACIVAAGNSGGPVQFPALVPSVLAVGAVGKSGEFPPDTGHAHSAIPHLVGSDGIFAARFSCAGPQVAVGAPGVAIVSTVPGGGYAALDGAALAAAHVSGLAVLILAHHPLFQGPLKTRSEQRVASLYGLIQASVVPHFADSLRGGAGVPDALRVPGLSGTAGAQPYFAGAPQPMPMGMFGTMMGGGLAQPATGSDPLANLMSALGPGSQSALPPYWSAATLQGWQTLMQMRAAGLI